MRQLTRIRFLLLQHISDETQREEVTRILREINTLMADLQQDRDHYKRMVEAMLYHTPNEDLAS